MPRTGKRRSTSQVIRDRRRIADLYLQGWLQADIGDEIGIDQSTVSRDLKALQQEWMDATLADLDTIKAKELAKIDKLEREYYRGWVRSLQDAVTVRERASGDEVETTTTTKPQAGDNKFLDGIDKCIARRWKVLGLDKLTHEIEAGPRLDTILSGLPDGFRETVRQALTEHLS